MHRIDGAAAAPGGLFTEGDPNVGTPATVVTDDWLNAVQEEIAGVIEGSGTSLSKPSNAQLLSAIRVLIGAAIPAGAVNAFAGEVAPAGWLKCNGAAVSRAAYPALFAYLGTRWGVGDGSTTFGLPDLRGEFIRGWDDGRGIDAARSVGVHQLDALQNITGSFGATSSDVTSIADGTGAFVHDGPTSAQLGADSKAPEAGFTFDASRVARTAAETRPRNHAMVYCIKA